MTINIPLPKNWRSTVSALVGCIGGYVMLHPNQFPPVVKDIAGYIALGGLAALGITTKDANVSAASELAEVVNGKQAAAVPETPKISPEFLKMLAEELAKQPKQ